MMNLKKILFTIISHMTNDNFSQKICADILTKRCIHIQYHKRIQTKSKFNYNNKAPLIKHSLIHNNNLHQKVTSTKKHSNIIDSLIVDFERIMYNNDNKINHETQILFERQSLEEFKFIEQFKEKTEMKNLNPIVSKFVIDNYEKLSSIINDIIISLSRSKNVNKYIYKILSEVNLTYLTDLAIHTFIKVLCFQNLENNSKTSRLKNKTVVLLPTSIFIGNSLLRHYKYKTVEDYRSSNNSTISFSDWNEQWIKDNKEFNDSLDDKFLSELGIKLLEALFWSKFLDKILIKTGEGSHYELYVDNDKLNKSIVKNTTLAFPSKIAMIVEPKDYTKDSPGGYLSNNKYYFEELFIKKSNYKAPTTIEEENMIFDTVNNISKVPFKINTVVLDYILNNPWLVLNAEHEFQKIPLEERSWQKKRTIVSHNSKYMLEQTILSLASFYRIFPRIYFPVKLDQRGRLYCQPDYLNYQGNSMARSLLLFSKPGTIDKTNETALNYLKIYGSIQYGKSLGKKNFKFKIDWVNDNYNKIINYEESDILQTCDEENRLLFLAFCIEMKRYDIFSNDPNQFTFDTYLPIQLDATCNGFQHLSLLSDERKLFEELNLVKSDNGPRDFYNFILNKVKEKCADKVKKGVIIDSKTEGNYESLSNIVLTRRNLKKSIMTVPYNVSRTKMKDYLVDTLYPVGEDDFNTRTLKKNLKEYALSEDNPNETITSNDVNLLSSLLVECIFNDYEKLNKLITYLKHISKICNTLKVPIIWNLPNGLKISQSYLENKVVSISPFTYSKTKLNLRVTLDSFDSNKQTRALMPNLIHSLDATSLSMLYSYFREEMDDPQFYSIHDCFGTTADKADTLKSLLVMVYVNIYSDNNYLKQFHTNFIKFIESTVEAKVYEKQIIKKGDSRLKIPDIDWVTGDSKTKKPLYQIIEAENLLI